MQKTPILPSVPFQAGNPRISFAAPALDGNISNTANIVAAGLAPTIRINPTPAVASPTITTAGLAPTFFFRATPGRGNITAAGLAPTPKHLPQPGRGNITSTGLTATLKLGITPGRGNITSTGLAPTTRIVATPGRGNITLAGLELQGGMVVTNAAAIQARGLNPSIRILAPTPSAGVLVRGMTATLYHRSTPGAANIALAGLEAVAAGGGGGGGPPASILGTVLNLTGVGR